MSYDTWGGSWGSSWGTSWTRTNAQRGVRLYRTYEKKPELKTYQYPEDVLPPTEQPKQRVHGNNAAALAVMLRRRLHF